MNAGRRYFRHAGALTTVLFLLLSNDSRGAPTQTAIGYLAIGEPGVRVSVPDINRRFFVGDQEALVQYNERYIVGAYKMADGRYELFAISARQRPLPAWMTADRMMVFGYNNSSTRGELLLVPGDRWPVVEKREREYILEYRFEDIVARFAVSTRMRGIRFIEAPPPPSPEPFIQPAQVASTSGNGEPPPVAPIPITMHSPRPRAPAIAEPATPRPTLPATNVAASADPPPGTIAAPTETPATGAAEPGEPETAAQRILPAVKQWMARAASGAAATWENLTLDSEGGMRSLDMRIIYGGLVLLLLLLLVLEQRRQRRKRHNARRQPVVQRIETPTYVPPAEPAPLVVTPPPLPRGAARKQKNRQAPPAPAAPEPKTPELPKNHHPASPHMPVPVVDPELAAALEAVAPKKPLRPVVGVARAHAPVDDEYAQQRKTIIPQQRIDVKASSSAGRKPVQVELTSVGRYRIIERLGEGSTGVVYKALQEDLERIVALKVLYGGSHASQATRERFLREARALAKLRHPNIVTVFDVGEQGGQPFFAMEFIRGPTLEDLIPNHRFNAEVVRNLMIKICEAVQYAHSQGIIHRDLKPGNIMMMADGQPVITDFGLARDMEDRMMSVSGDILGTPAYMPPEQAMGKTGQTDIRSDIYSLGAILYSLLAHRDPFQGNSLMETLAAVIRDQPPALDTNRGVSPVLAEICKKAMQKKPDDRYQSTAEMLQGLKLRTIRQP